jgi:hypothetical protein
LIQFCKINPVMVAVDYFTRYAVAKVLPSKATEEVVKTLD